MDMEVVHINLLKTFMSIAVVSVVGLLLRLYKAFVVEPQRVRALLKKQGIDGPPPKFLLGNLSEMKIKLRPTPMTTSADSTQLLDHNWVAHIYPCFETWRKQYGDTFVFSMGRMNILYVKNPALVRKIITHKAYDLGKPYYHRKEFGPLLGNGILTSNGPAWAVHRKILGPELFMDRVKGMAHHMSESAAIVINSWNDIIERGGGIADIDVDDYTRSFSGDVIARACFGSSYEKGLLIFSKLKTLQEATSDKLWTVGLPGLSDLPTKSNRRIWGLEKEIYDLIMKLVKERKEEGGDQKHKDLLQLIIEGAEVSELKQDEKDKLVVDNCKNIFLAANEATAIRASWALLLLASNQDWQDRVRAEVLQICGGGQIPDLEMLRNMKQLTMVLQETLRLYPSGPALAREALEDMKIGGLEVPKGVNLWTMTVAMHTDPEIWGPDAHIFNPGRFSNGVTAAFKQQQQQQDVAQAFYFPFGFGPRLCVGQHFAMVELKILFSLLLSNFTFTLSPNYVHSPTVKLVIQPEHGINLLVKKVVKN